MKKMIIGALAAVLVAVPAADAKQFRGTVVKKNKGSVVVATRTGSLKTVRTARHLGIGSVLRVSGRSVKVVGRAKSAKIRGVVRGRTATRVALSANRTVVSVRSRKSHAAGDALMVEVKIKNGVVSEVRSHDENDVDEAELKGIATFEGTTIHVAVGTDPVVDVTIPESFDAAALATEFDGKFVEIEFNVVDGVNVLAKIKLEDNEQEDEAEGLDDLKGALTVNPDGTTILVGTTQLNINGVDISAFKTGDLVEVHFDVVNDPTAGQVLNLTRIKAEDDAAAGGAGDGPSHT